MSPSRPDVAHAEAHRGQLRLAAVRAAVADGVRIGRPSEADVVAVHEARAVRLPQDVDGQLLADLPAQTPVVVEAQAVVDRGCRRRASERGSRRARGRRAPRDVPCPRPRSAAGRRSRRPRPASGSPSRSFVRPSRADSDVGIEPPVGEGLVDVVGHRAVGRRRAPRSRSGRRRRLRCRRLRRRSPRRVGAPGRGPARARPAQAQGRRRWRPARGRRPRAPGRARPRRDRRSGRARGRRTPVPR